MKRPTEHKTVQACILKYAQESGWTYLPRAEGERRRGRRMRNRRERKEHKDSGLDFSAFLVFFAVKHVCLMQMTPKQKKIYKPQRTQRAQRFSVFLFSALSVFFAVKQKGVFP